MLPIGTQAGRQAHLCDPQQAAHDEESDGGVDGAEAASDDAWKFIEVQEPSTFRQEATVGYLAAEQDGR